MKIIRYILRRIISLTKSIAAALKDSQVSSLKEYDTTGRKCSEMSIEEIAELWVAFCEERKCKDML